jgi:hypothetical protein
VVLGSYISIHVRSRHHDRLPASESSLANNPSVDRRSPHWRRSSTQSTQYGTDVHVCSGESQRSDLVFHRANASEIPTICVACDNVPSSWTSSDHGPGDWNPLRARLRVSRRHLARIWRRSSIDSGASVRAKVICSPSWNWSDSVPRYCLRRQTWWNRIRTRCSG